MLSLLSKKKLPLVGIDISPSSVKVLELSKNGEHYRVERYAVEPMPLNSIVEHAITEIEPVAEAVDRAIKRSGTKCKQAAVAIAGAHVISKIIRMPASLKERDMQVQIELEADHYIPYPLDEVNLDFQVQGPSKDNPEEEVDVLIVACRKEIVDDYSAVLQIHGMKAAVIDVETYAVENAYALIAQNMPGAGMERTTAIFDVGATTMTLNVIHNNQSVYIRDHNFGGRQLTEEIQRRYGLSYEEAGLAKKQGGLPDNYQTDVLQPFMESMCQEVSRALQFFYSSSTFSSVDQILLAGGCAQIAGVDELIAARLSLDTRVTNPFSNMSVASRIKPRNLANEAPSLLTACGLALRSFDP